MVVTKTKSVRDFIARFILVQVRAHFRMLFSLLLLLLLLLS